MPSLTNWVIILVLAARLFSGISPFQVDYLQAQPENFIVRLHPDQPLSAGDVVSFEVYAGSGADLKDQQVTVSLANPQSKVLGKANFELTAENKYRAILMWAWDTHGLESGQYFLYFSIKPAGIAWQQTVELHPAVVNSPYHWDQVTTDCCNIHYITGTNVERDLDTLVPEIDRQMQLVENELKHTLAKKIDINLLPRVLGQGGFTTDEIYFSVPVVNYLDTNLDLVLHHELVHIVDGDMGGELRPLILVEGLAVYLTGGHYRSEALLPRAATLIQNGLYIPVTNLAANFYSWQHEIGYLEAGSLVEYMVDAWGWDAYNRFYRDIHPVPGADESAAFDKALQAHFGITLRALDDRFYNYLRTFPVNPDLSADVISTARLFDTVRAYQQALDPSAYFQEVWLPDANQMRAKGIVADYLRRDESPRDAAIESLLVLAGDAWDKGDFDETSRLLYQVMQNIPK